MSKRINYIIGIIIIIFLSACEPTTSVSKQNDTIVSVPDTVHSLKRSELLIYKKLLPGELHPSRDSSNLIRIYKTTAFDKTTVHIISYLNGVFRCKFAVLWGGYYEIEILKKMNDETLNSIKNIERKIENDTLLEVYNAIDEKLGNAMTIIEYKNLERNQLKLLYFLNSDDYSGDLDQRTEQLLGMVKALFKEQCSCEYNRWN